MKLTDKEFKRFKDLEKKGTKRTKDENAEYLDLKHKKETQNDPSKRAEFKPGNDFSWWNKNPELIRDSASFKCNWIPGTYIAPGAFNFEGVGVVRIDLRSVCGSSTSATDPVNVWARDLYLRMFQKYRPASGYTASDLGIAILAGLEAVKLIATYERIYGIFNRYSVLNVNMPLREAAALGLSAAQVSYLQGHLSDFRYDLNYLIKKAQRLCIPKDLSVVADAISLFGYEYTDHESVRSQLILFAQADYGVYSDTALSSGGSIRFDDLTTLFSTSADNMCVALDTVLNALLGSDSIQRIYADLVVWFGQGAMLEFLPVPEDYVMVPVKSESILHKMHNLEMVNDSTMRMVSFVDGALPTADQTAITGLHYVYQCDDRIITTVAGVLVPGGSAVTPDNYTVHGIIGYIPFSSGPMPLSLIFGHVIDTMHNDIDPEIIVEGSLFKFTGVQAQGPNTGGNALVFDSACFYFVSNISLYRNLATSPTPVATATNITTTAQQRGGILACLDWAPLVFDLNNSGSVGGIFGDYDNVVFVSNPDLSRIQRTIVLSGIHTDVTVVNK